MIVSWNDALMESTEAKVSIEDATYLRGEGVFETIRAQGGRPLFFQDHYERLRGAAGHFLFELPSVDALRGSIEKVLQANALSEARVRVTLGESCLVTAVALEEEVPEVAVVTGEAYPINERSPLAGVKCTSYAENMALLRRCGSAEVIRPNTRGELCEGCLSNVFFLKDGQVFTPALETGCLPGVMRKQVMARVGVEVGCWPFEVILDADEIWLSNSLRRVRAVRELDGKALAEPGELFHKLRSEIG